MDRSQHLQALELSGNPTPEQIKQAHRRVSLKLHPDKGGTDGQQQAANAARDALLVSRPPLSSWHWTPGPRPASSYWQQHQTQQKQQQKQQQPRLTSWQKLHVLLSALHEAALRRSTSGAIRAETDRYFIGLLHRVDCSYSSGQGRSGAVDGPSALRAAYRSQLTGKTDAELTDTFVTLSKGLDRPHDLSTWVASCTRCETCHFRGIGIRFRRTICRNCCYAADRARRAEKHEERRQSAGAALASQEPEDLLELEGTIVVDNEDYGPSSCSPSPGTTSQSESGTPVTPSQTEDVRSEPDDVATQDFESSIAQAPHLKIQKASAYWTKMLKRLGIRPAPRLDLSTKDLRQITMASIQKSSALRDRLREEDVLHICERCPALVLYHIHSYSNWTGLCHVCYNIHTRINRQRKRQRAA